MGEFIRNPTTFKDGWVSQNMNLILQKYSLNTEQQIVIRHKLEEIYDANLKKVKVNVVNNYKNYVVQTSLDEIADMTLQQKVVLGGDGVLFKQHDTQLSILVPVILKYQNERTKEKNLAKSFEKGSSENLYHNRNQVNKKVVINGLYGLFGYPKFRFFNVNLAQSVTAMGQNIISTATCMFEDFLSDNSKFLTFNECIEYIMKLANDTLEFESKYAKEFNMLPEISIEMLVERIAKRTYHIMTEAEASYVIELLSSLSSNQRKLLYYKNNLMEFNNTEFIHNIIVTIMDNIEKIQLGELYAFDDMEKHGVIANPEVKDTISYLLDLYGVFVLSRHQIYDRVRRTKYTRKKSVLYIDTDSNFIGLGRFIDYFASTVPDKFNNEENFIFKCTSIMTMILSYAIREIYTDFTDSLNICKEYGVRLNMKNEFLFSILLFGLVKKRYIGKMIIQEGKLIKGGKGDIEVKGFDFKKATTKKPVHDRICDIINDYILNVKQISLVDVLRACNKFKADIRTEILSGSNLYYRQLSVAKPDKYKNPWSNQGVKGVLLWNAIVDDTDTIELPAEVDIIPITICTLSHSSETTSDHAPKRGGKGTTQQFVSMDPEEFFSLYGDKHKALYQFYRDFPVEFERMRQAMRENSDIWTKIPSGIAKPRALTELPDWLKSIINVTQIEANVINLVNPVVESLGVNIAKTKVGPMYTTIVEF